MLLRENLEIKFRIARSRGKVIEDGDLLVVLAGLGSEPVCGVVLDHRGQHIALYLRATTLGPVGCTVI